ncbi:MAG: hypothetical protein H6713_06525 [Myxococcales bacterium]|nr:hypothetical protein [Myxococcales bacterium]MCB9749648.1 hypothetical protein [Myxococcales bacterium]
MRTIAGLAVALALTSACAPALFVGRSERVTVRPCESRSERAPLSSIDAVAAGDLDGDGRHELVLLSRRDDGRVADARVLWWRDAEACLGPPSPTWADPPPRFEATRYDPPDARTPYVDVADVDVDGLPDLIVSVAGSHELAVVYGTGAREAPFTTPRVLRPARPIESIPAPTASSDAPECRAGRVWYALMPGAHPQRPDLRVSGGWHDPCAAHTLVYAAAGPRDFAPGRYFDGPGDMYMSHARRRGAIFSDWFVFDAVDVSGTRVKLREAIIINHDQVSSRPVRLWQPFPATYATLISLGERWPSRNLSTPPERLRPVDRVVIADARRVAILRHRDPTMRWWWTVFELPGPEASAP